MSLEIGKKFVLYLRAAVASGSLNLPGFPLAPKTAYFPSCRGSYNTFILWMEQLGLPKAERIFDVGANHGDFARAASHCYPEADVWLFEPLPTLWPKLEALARRFARWNVEKIAFGDATGNLPLQVAEDDNIGSFLGFSDLYQRRNPAGKTKQSIDARVERLDDFCIRHGIDSIDLLKIDVEGFEFHVLAGAICMLPETTAIIVEVSLIRQSGEATNALERMIHILSDNGFTIADVIPSLFSNEEPWRPLEYNLLARRSY